MIAKSGLSGLRNEKCVNKSGKCRAIAEPRRQLAKFSFHFTDSRWHVIDGRRQQDFGLDLMFSIGLRV